jgi:hypothetical protein
MRKGIGLRRRIRLIALLLVGLVAAPAVRAAPGLSLEYGDALSEDVEMAQLNLSRSFGTRWQLTSWLTVEPLWEVSVGHVAPAGRLDRFEDTWTAAAQLVLQTPLTDGGRIFAELGTGPVYISEEVLQVHGEELDWGSNILWRTQIGLGAYLDPEKRFFLSYRLQHTSNAGLGDINPGIDFQILQVGFSF